MLDFTAQMDQLGEASVEIARVVARYYAALLQQGIPEDVVVALTLEFQRKLLQGGG